ncbi:MAG: hypothetical protein HY319_17250 [Armatimonadetes bacterium]|nr:hypothetical protein [Armatimonadota bacterium]
MDVPTLQDSGWIQLFTELGAMGIVTWLIYTTFSRTLPRMQEEFVRELQEERRLRERAVRQIRAAIDRLTTFLLYHDASIRGKSGPTDEVVRLMKQSEEEAQT